MTVIAIEAPLHWTRRTPDDRLGHFPRRSGEHRNEQPEKRRYRPRIVQRDAGARPSGMYPVDDVLAARAPGKLMREQYLGELACSICPSARLVLGCVRDIVKIDVAHFVCGAGSVNHAHIGCPGEEQRQDLAREQEIGKVIKREGELEAIGAPLSLREYGAPVVHGDVKPLLPRAGLSGDPLDLGDLR
jgi:hypothetical protein